MISAIGRPRFAAHTCRSSPAGIVRRSSLCRKAAFAAAVAVVAATSLAQIPAGLETLPMDGRERAAAHLPGADEAYLPTLFPSSHASNLLQLKDGTLLCVWFSGTWEGDAGVGIVLARLDPGSRQWSRPQLIDRREGESFQNPMLFQAPDGTLHLYHTTQRAGAGEANAYVLTLTSNDNGHTWTEPRPLFSKAGAYTRHPIVVLPNGTWLLPLTYVTSAGIDAGAETNYSAMELSSDAGRTWRECVIPKSQGKVQPTVVVLGPDHYLAAFRSRAADFIYRSESTDGCHWSPPVATVLPNNNASVQMTRLHDGHLVMVFDNSSVHHTGPKPTGGARKPLSMALSMDEGKTWPYVRDIERGRPGADDALEKAKAPGREEYSYPTVTQTKDGTIYAAFTFRRQTIKVVSFKEGWIRDGGTVGEYKGSSNTR